MARGLREPASPARELRGRSSTHRAFGGRRELFRRHSKLRAQIHARRAPRCVELHEHVALRVPHDAVEARRVQPNHVTLVEGERPIAAQERVNARWRLPVRLLGHVGVDEAQPVNQPALVHRQRPVQVRRHEPFDRVRREGEALVPTHIRAVAVVRLDPATPDDEAELRLAPARDAGESKVGDDAAVGELRDRESDPPSVRSGHAAQAVQIVLDGLSGSARAPAPQPRPASARSPRRRPRA